MKNHYFEPSGDAGEEAEDICELCGETVDSAIHDIGGKPPDRSDDVAGEDWPPNVVAYLEAVGIRNPSGT